MGLLHDIGKCSAAYQSYIRSGNRPDGQRGPDHSTAGAKEAVQRYGSFIGRMMAFGIAGHHSGLMNGPDLSRRHDKQIECYSGWEEHVSGLPDMAAIGSALPPLGNNGIEPAFKVFFLIRMLFSCLVDADFLETERFYAEAQGLPAPERGGRVGQAHRDAVRRYMAAHRRDDSEVNRLRSAILDHAVGKAALPPGLFTLTVPTGGGKTLTSLSFAVEHALAHGLERIIHVSPFTAIIEQSAAEFRKALRPELEKDVLEHHSNFDWDEKEPAVDGDYEEEGPNGLAKLRRDAENWDAPIVVTTAVQFFESLFAARTSRARKLHNLAKSVIVIDEAQSIPVRLLRPCMAAIDELARNYGATVVLCTATQPALRLQDEALPEGRRQTRQGWQTVREGLDIPDARELAPDPAGLYEKLRRVAVDWRREPVADADIAVRFAERPQMLCIVNSRGHARELFAAIREQEGAVHLTTLMCARHRRQVLDEVRQQLKDGRPVRLVATSLIEAGVDLSFPEVWRAAAGLSNIAQAAGRCNRSGELGPLGDAFGRAVVFEPAAVEGRQPVPRDLVPFYEAARTVLRNPELDPLGLQGVAEYYRNLYWRQGHAALDRTTVDGAPYEIVREIGANISGTAINFPFRTISDAFRMIDETMGPVLIPFDAEAKAALERLEHALFPPAGIQRKLQHYVVPVPAKVRTAMLARDDLRPVRDDYGDRFIVLANEELYDPVVGLGLDDHVWRSSESNVVS
jgi:CRISPR-associated endonuclease/helicase Cas3